MLTTKIFRYKQIPNLISNWQSVIQIPKSKPANYAVFNNKIVLGQCNFSVSSCLSGSAGRAETTSTTQGLSKLQAQELVLRLNGEERNILISALQEYQSKLVKDEYEGKLHQVS